MNAYRDFAGSLLSSDVLASLERNASHQGMQEDIIAATQQVHGALSRAFQDAAAAADEQAAAAAEITRPPVFWWGCAESYSGSGRPSRVWAQATESPEVRPDDPDENGESAYPFNGMGGEVVAGPFPTEREAERAVLDMIEDEGGWLEWK